MDRVSVRNSPGPPALSRRFLVSYVVGIDPGQKGGVVLLTKGGDIEVAIPMPDAHVLADHLDTWRPDHVFIEKAQAMPRNGAVSMFNYGLHFGQLQGLCVALQLGYTLVTPKTWQRTMFIGTTGAEPKKRAYQAASRIFPGQDFRASERSKKPSDGIVDAALIATWGFRHLALKDVKEGVWTKAS